MQVICPHCNHEVSTHFSAEGQVVACPYCNGRFSSPARVSVAMPPSRAELNTETLRDPKESLSFSLLAVLSIFAWLFLLVWIVSSLGIVLVFIGIAALVRYFVSLFAIAYIKTNGVEVTENQFPDIYRIAHDFARRVAKPLPRIYVLQDNVWNAVAMKAAHTRLVVLNSAAVDSLLLKGSLTQLAWLVGHELGHHYAGHLNFWRHLTVQFGSWFVWGRLWYSRRCELTCDRYGLACAGSLSESLRAVCNMAVGAQLAGRVDVDQAIAQWQRHRHEFFVTYRTLYSTHPHALWRLEELNAAARELGVS